MIEQKSLIQFLQSLPAGSPIILSACLLGVRCRYNAAVQHHPDLLEILAPYYVIPVCPEQLGGLPTPRPRSVLYGGDGYAVLDGTARVVADDGTDITDVFLNGARQTAEIACRCGVVRAILTERSPSCGIFRVYIDDELVSGTGVTAAILDRHGVTLTSSEELDT